MKLLFTLLFICFTNVVLSHTIVNDHIIMHDFTTPVITFVKLKTGEVTYTTTLKEKTLNVKVSENNKWIYAMTKHYAYKINALNGEIQTEFLFQPFLKKSADDFIDPNMNLFPIGLNSDGIGFYFNAMDTPIALYKVDIKNQIKTTFGKLDHTMGQGKFLYENNLYLYEMSNPYSEGQQMALKNLGMDMNQLGGENIVESKKSYKFHVIPTNAFRISETFEIPMNLGKNEYDLSSEDISSIHVSSILGDTLNVLLLNSKKSLKNYKIFYQYDLSKQQMLGLNGFKLVSPVAPPYYQFNQQTDKYKAIADCPEKERMPMPEMEVYTPEKHNKKARAEAEKINNERLEQYQRDLEAYNSQAYDFSHCTLFIKTVKTDEVILEIDGLTTVSLIRDNYLLYHDGLEYIMYDISKGETIWTLMN